MAPLCMIEQSIPVRITFMRRHGSRVEHLPYPFEKALRQNGFCNEGHFLVLNSFSSEYVLRIAAQEDYLHMRMQQPYLFIYIFPVLFGHDPVKDCELYVVVLLCHPDYVFVVHRDPPLLPEVCKMYMKNERIVYLLIAMHNYH